MQSAEMPNNRKISSRKPSRPSANTQSKVQNEVKRLQEITRDAMPENQRKVAMPLIHNVAWMKVKLDEARLDLMYENIFVPYDNGGGQTGLREHPGFAAYNKLFTTFQRGIKQLIDLMDEFGDGSDELLEYIDGTKITA